MAVGNYVAGVLVALVTTFLSATGLAFQKKTHQRLESRREAARRSGVPDPALRSYRQKLWVVGIILMAISSLASLAVFALLGQAVASSMASLTMVWNLGWATLFLHEVFTLLDGVVTLILIMGAVLSVVFGKRGNAVSSFLSPSEIQSLFARGAVYIFSSIIAVLVIASFAYLYMLERRRDLGIATRAQVRASMVMRCFLAGAFSGFTGTCSKGVVTSISYAFKFEAYSEVFTWWGFYMLLLFLPVSLILQVMYLNSALKVGDATEVVPIYQALIVLLGVCYGWVYYSEGSGKSSGDQAGFWCGALLIVAGISLLLLKHKRQPEALTVAEAIDRLMRIHAKASALRRTRSAPACPRPFLCFAGQYGGMDGRATRVMVLRPAGTEARFFKLLKDGDRSVSGEELLSSPKGVPGTATAGTAFEDRAAPSLSIDVAMPVSPSVMTAPVKDKRYRRTMAVAALAQLRPGYPRPAPQLAFRRVPAELPLQRGAELQEVKFPPLLPTDAESKATPTAASVTAQGTAGTLVGPGVPGAVLAQAVTFVRPLRSPAAAGPRPSLEMQPLSVTRTPVTENWAQQEQLRRTFAAVERGDGAPTQAGITGSAVPASPMSPRSCAAAGVCAVPALLVPPALLLPAAVIRNVSISPSLLAAALRAAEDEEDVGAFEENDVAPGGEQGIVSAASPGEAHGEGEGTAAGAAGTPAAEAAQTDGGSSSGLRQRSRTAAAVSAESG